MNMPGFTAEASLYKTSNHYRFAAGGSFLSDGKTTVTLQGCGFVERIVCGSAIVGGTVLCTSACLSGPAPCAACWTGALAIVGYGFCRDCIPAWMRALIDIFEGGGGDGGGTLAHVSANPVAVVLDGIAVKLVLLERRLDVRKELVSQVTVCRLEDCALLGNHHPVVMEIVFLLLEVVSFSAWMSSLSMYR